MSSSGVSGSARATLPPRRRGRPPRVLSKEQVNKICELVEAGVPQGTAARVVAGVPSRTFMHWLEWGRREDAVEPYASLADRLEEAKARWHASRVIELNLAVDAADPRTQTNVIMWELERRAREEWGQPERGGTTVNVQVVLEAERRQASEQLLAAAARVLADDPERLALLIAEVAGGQVVEGEAVEVAELEP